MSSRPDRTRPTRVARFGFSSVVLSNNALARAGCAASSSSFLRSSWKRAQRAAYSGNGTDGVHAVGLWTDIDPINMIAAVPVIPG